ncbi:MAG: hypothetical protein KAT16_08375 [Candidatus Heimdallarchaeota archaeon]|nr:hypothetical protein [Candidatus Heimdallarchaeota archaeon]
MNEPFNSLFQERNKVVHIFGTPGTFKTAFLVQIIIQKLEEGINQIYLVDVGGNFPYLKLEPIKDLLTNLIVFQPKTLQEELITLDDLELNKVDTNTIILIDDVFRRVNPDIKEDNHIESYILAQIMSISHTVEFPIFLTNEGRVYDNNIYPFRQALTEYYFDEHLLFENVPRQAKIRIKKRTDNKYTLFTELKIEKSGFISGLFQ